MPKIRVSIALILTVLATGAAFASGPTSAASDSPKAPQAAPADDALTGQLDGLFPPKPEYKIGMKNGPCTVSVTCIGNYQIRCSGQSICYWKVDSASSRGYVECDGFRTTCSPIALIE